MKKIIEYIVLFVVAAGLLVLGVIMTKNNKQDDTTPAMDLDVITPDQNSGKKTENNDETPTTNLPSTWEIVDETAGITCTQVITAIYEDENYIYEVANPCIENNIYVLFPSGEKITIKEALNQKKVTVDELINKGISITKTAKTLTWEIEEEMDGVMCALVITKIYEDENYVYTVSSPCKAEKIFVKFSNGEKNTIKEALNQKKVTVDELINKGITINKEGKMHTN